MKKKNCYYILTRFPFPAVGGDRVKSYNVTQILNRNYNLTLVLITHEKLTEECDKFLKANSVAFKIFRFPKIFFVLNSFKSLFNRLPIQCNYYSFSKVKRYLAKEVREEDIVVCNLVRTATYVDGLPCIKILDMVDSIYLNYRNSINSVSSFFWRFIYSFELPLLQKIEGQLVKEFCATVLVNRDEALFWSEYGPCYWIPNGVSNKALSYAKKEMISSCSIVFLGKMDYQPNVDAVRWFCKKILPFLHENIKLLIIGPYPSNRLVKELSVDERVEFLGFVEDPYPIIAAAFLSIAPMQTGGGMQNKIIEVMALGQIVVTTQLGAGPIIGAENRKHLLICDSAETMANTINDVYWHPEAYMHISNQAKEFVAQKYTWDNYERALVDVIKTHSLPSSTSKRD